MSEWMSRDDLERHFGLHGRDVGARTLEAYEASSKDVVERGTLFEYEYGPTGERRLGYYDRDTRRFTAVTEDDRWIKTHFRCPEYYVRDILTGSTYA